MVKNTLGQSDLNIYSGTSLSFEWIDICMTPSPPPRKVGAIDILPWVALLWRALVEGEAYMGKRVFPTGFSLGFSHQPKICSSPQPQAPLPRPPPTWKFVLILILSDVHYS